jgi:hypothetical protein
MKVFFGLILLILGLFMVNFSQISAEEFEEVILSPKKQIDSGKSPNEVICKEGLELIFKSSNGSPACVKSQTIEKLLLRNWAITHPISLVVFYTDKTEYEFGEPITISMKNESNEIFSTPSVPVGFSIIDENGVRICSWIGMYEAIGQFHPQQNVTKTWGQKYCEQWTPIESEIQVPSGIYTIIGDHFIYYPKPFPRLEIRIVE